MSETTMPENAPDTLIVPTGDLINQFIGDTHGKVWQQDLNEILTEIVQVLLNESDGNLAALEGLPQVNRMLNTDFEIDAEYYALVNKAAIALGTGLYRRLKEMGAYVDETFSYFFDQFLGDDLVLRLLPY